MRNINLIVQKQPNMLQTDVRYFVCKYNDPLYVKLEKIAVMVWDLGTAKMNWTCGTHGPLWGGISGDVGISTI